MRYILFDRITRFEPGRRIEGVKCVSMTEEYLRGRHPLRPTLPGTLLVEAMIQLLAWLAIAEHDFRLSLVLSVLEDVSLPEEVEPGRRIDLGGELVGTNPKGSIGRAWASLDGRQVAAIGRVLYAHVPVPDPDALRREFRQKGGPL